MWVGMVRLVAMDMVFPTGSAKIGRVERKLFNISLFMFYPKNNYSVQLN